MTTDESGAQETGADIQPEIPAEAEPTASGLRIGGFARRTGRRIARQRHIGKITAAAALVALLGAGWVLGAPPSTDSHSNSYELQRSASLSDKAASVPGMISAGGGAAAATAGPAQPVNGSDTTTTTTDGSSVGVLPLTAANEGSVIIKTGQLSLEVGDVDKAVATAQSTVNAAGGYISASSRSGSDQYAVANITFRIPAAKWDDSLASLRKIGSKVVSEQTDASDVTMQVVDLNARIENLQKAEAALQSIMARASSVPDIIVVQTQLTQTEGQIEELTAQRDHVNDQAAMSTLTLSLSLPQPTVTTQATQDWTLSNQVDQAGAALVRIGQGLVTLGIWGLIVVLPVAFGLLILFGIILIGRRIARRGGKPEAAAS